MNFENPSVVEVNEYIRFWLGGLPQTTISDDILNYIITLVIDRGVATTGCDLIYLSAVDLLKYLVRKDEQGSTGGVTTGSGELKKIIEKVGNQSITQEFDVGSSSTSSKESGWDRVLSDLQSNPDSIGCPVTQGGTSVKGVGKPHFGGVSQKEYDRVRNDPDSRNGYHTSSPFRQHLK
jgi:hypothetical protein